MFAAMGCPVSRLARVRIDGLRLGELRAGEVRALTAAEVRGLAGPTLRRWRGERRGHDGRAT
jgi:16S rRNA U516 pseudouridylate synthase RsuA-like enzyme